MKDYESLFDIHFIIVANIIAVNHYYTIIYFNNIKICISFTLYVHCYYTYYKVYSVYFQNKKTNRQT